MRTRTPSADRIALVEAAIAVGMAAERLGEAARQMQRLLQPRAKRQPDLLDDYLNDVRQCVVSEPIAGGNIVPFPRRRR